MSGASALLIGAACRRVKKDRLKIAIAKAVDGELAAVDSLQESQIVFGPRTESADAFAPVSRRFADVADQFSQRRRRIGGS